MKTNKLPLFFTVATGLLLLSVWLSLRLGSVILDTADFYAALFRAEGYRTESTVLFSLRLPRILAACLAGMGLSLSGVLLQGVTDNALASPSLIGVNAGAGFAVALSLLFFPSLYFLSPLFALLGAIATTALILFFSSRVGGSRTSLILAGVSFTALLNAAISALTLIDTDLLASYNAFSIGSFAGIRYPELILPAVLILASLAVAMLFSRDVELLSLGDMGASTLGVPVKRTRTVAVLAASASAAASVSLAGLLGFVGLIVPHVARRFVGNKTARLLPASALIGAAVTTLSDLLGRLLIRPSELPVGIVTAFIGAPFFMALLLQRSPRERR